MNPNDEVRRQILQYFYDRNAKATSRFGKKGSAAKISDVKKELKTRYGLSQQQVMSNLTYLIDRGWVKTLSVEKTVRVSGGTVPSAVTWYEISALGIEKIEGGSEYQPRERYPGININATGTNTITLGDGNVVNARYSDLRQALDDLKNALSESDLLNEKDKLDVAVDIETLKDQLAKPSPNRAVASQLWSGVEAAATGAGLIYHVSRIAPLIAALVEMAR